MNRYLVFDATCAICRELAEVTQRVAAGRVEAIGLHDPRTQALLDRIHPNGWAPAPYLIIAGEGPARAWTGGAAALRLAFLVGPRGAWHLWAAARRRGISVPPAPTRHLGKLHPRRAFLKLLVGIAVALGSLGIFPRAALACAPCESCGFRDVRTFRCLPGSACGGGRYYLDYYDRYDARSGDYCYSYAAGCCGYCCP